MRKSIQGFTLIELMITVSIIAILAVIAVPSYVKHMQRSHRTDAMSALMRIAADQEKFYFQNSRYATLAELGSPKTENDWYNLFVFAPSANGFTAMAMAKSGGPQFGDEQCRRFLLTSAGIRLAFSASNGRSENCWR
jgi:type IV pilus assembly protein PilE